MFSPYHMADTAMWLSGQSEADSRPPSATSLHPWHHQPPPRPPPPRVYASTSNLPDCFPVIDPLHAHRAGHLYQQAPVSMLDASSSHRHPVAPMRSRASTLDRTSSEQRLRGSSGPGNRSTSYSQLTGLVNPNVNVGRHERARTVDRSMYPERQRRSSQVNTSTGSTLNLKVWKQDEEGNFLKHYPNHHRRNSMVTLDQNERMKRYAEIQKEVHEKYFNKSSSVDCLQTTTTVARSSVVREFTPFYHQSNEPSSLTSYPSIRPTVSLSPIKSVTAKILSTFDLRSKRGPSKEHLYQTMITQQNQLQHLTSQQQYLQAQILWQQKQLREAELELIDHRSSRSRSRGSKEETSDREIEKARKMSTRMEIQESLHKQQTQVAQHILNLQAQLNLLMQRTSAQQQQQQQQPVTSLVSVNNSHSPQPEPIQFTSHTTETGNLALARVTDSPSSATSKLHQSHHNEKRQDAHHATVTSSSDNKLPVNQSNNMKGDDLSDTSDNKITTIDSIEINKVKRRNPPLTTPELSLQEVESAELRFEGDEDDIRPTTPDATSRGNLLTPKYNNNSPPAESDIEDPDEVWLPDDDRSAVISSTGDTASPSLPPIPFGGRRGAFKPLSPMNSIIKQKSTDSRDAEYLDFTDLEEEDLDLPLPFDIDDTDTSTNRDDRRQRLREQIKWEIEEEKRKQLEKDVEDEKYRKIKEREIENELSLKRLEREAAFLREMEEKELELKVKQNELMRQAENEMLRQQQEFLNQQKLLLEQQEQLAKQRNELELQQQQLAYRQEKLLNQTGSTVEMSTVNLLPPKPQRAPRRASADEMAINALSRNYTLNDDRSLRSSLPHVERDVLSSPSSTQISSIDLHDTRHDNSLNQLSSVPSSVTASTSLVPPLDSSFTHSIVRPLSPIPPLVSPPSLEPPPPPAGLAQDIEMSTRSLSPPGKPIDSLTNSSAIPVRTFAQLNSERSGDLTKEHRPIKEDNEITTGKILAPSAVQLEKDAPPPVRRQMTPSVPISPQESLLDHFDQYSSRPSSALAISRRAGSRARSVSKEPENSTSSQRTALSRQESGSIFGGSRTGLSAIDSPETLPVDSFVNREGLCTPTKPSGLQNHPLIDDMLLSHPAGRRQTLPDVINALDIESSPSTSSNVALVTTRAPVMPTTGGAGGARGRPLKGKKSFEETITARKMSVPSDSAVAPPEGWSREKVSEMAHAAREKRMASATEKKSIPWGDWFLWLFHDRLVLIMLVFNGLLLYFFYNLVTQGANSSSTQSTESTQASLLKSTSEKTLQLHQFLNSFFNHPHETRKGE